MQRRYADSRAVYLLGQATRNHRSPKAGLFSSLLPLWQCRQSPPCAYWSASADPMDTGLQWAKVVDTAWEDLRTSTLTVTMTDNGNTCSSRRVRLRTLEEKSVHSNAHFAFGQCIEHAHQSQLLESAWQISIQDMHVLNHSHDLLEDLLYKHTTGMLPLQSSTSIKIINCDQHHIGLLLHCRAVASCSDIYLSKIWILPVY